jgi:hypothetical protein
MDYAGKFFTLGSSQIKAVDHPVIVAPAVEAVLLPHAVGKHLSFGILFSWDWVGFFLVEVSVDIAAAAAAVATADFPCPSVQRQCPPLKCPWFGAAGRRIYIGPRAGGPCHRCGGRCPNP